MAVAGMHSAEGNLYYFFSVHSSMLMIGCVLQRREKRVRKAAAPSSKSSVASGSNAKSK
jgi:hypothetical protein